MTQVLRNVYRDETSARDNPQQPSATFFPVSKPQPIRNHFFLDKGIRVRETGDMSEWRLRKRPPRRPYYVEFWHGGKWHSISTKTSKKPLALKIARKRYDEILAGTYDVAPRGRRKVSELFDLYLKDCEARVAGRKGRRLQPATLIRGRNAIRRVLEGIRVTWPQQLTEQKLAEYMSRRLSGVVRKRQHSKPRKASAFGFNLEMRHLKAFLNWAKRSKFIRDVPPIPKAQTLSKGRDTFLTEAEIGPVLSNIEPCERWAAFLLVHTGLRLEEMRFLEWMDVDLEVGVLRIRRKPELNFSPKQGKQRDVPISPALANELMRRRQSSGWVCPNRRGSQLCKRKLSEALAKAGWAAGLTKRITPHVLRHTFGSLAVLQGMPLKVLADIMGHSTVAMTEIYVHSEQEQRIAAMAKFTIGGIDTSQKVIRMVSKQRESGER